MHRPARAWAGAALAAALALTAPAVPAAPGSPLPLDEVTSRLICDCGCNNLTVKNCTCGKADRIRADVAARLSAGLTPDRIIQVYVEEYGEQILAAPTRRGFNLVGWIVPFAAVLIGAAFLVVLLRRWARVPASEVPLVPPLSASAAAPSDPSFLRKVREELDEVER